MTPIENAINHLDLGHNLLITGGAGTGKSYNLNKIIDWANDKDLQIARTALTGMACLQFECGETLHRCFGIGFNKNKKDLSKVVQTYNFRTEKRYELEVLDLIIVDEISMLRSDTLELCDAVLKYVMGNDEPFGGKQIIFSGDFMQLPPIVKPEEKQAVPKPWAFQSPTWAELDLKIIYLTEIKRQNDPHFAMALNMVRAGAINEAVDEYFFNTHKNRFPEGTEPIKLLSTNFEIQRVNDMHLKKIDAPVEDYKADIDGLNEKLKDKIIRDCPAVANLELKIGAQVMILINSRSYDYVNGSMGEYLGKETAVVKLLDDYVEVDALSVRLFDSGETVLLPEYEWKNEKKENDKTTKLASFKQFPVKLGWAITIHKSQGMSLDFMEVDLTRCFAEGMAYVALSRARNYEGLKIINWRPGAVQCNKDAFNFYMGLKNAGVI